jgi:hypothetical protein
MSPSESTGQGMSCAAVAETVERFVENALHGSASVDITAQDARRLVSAVTRLYAACCESAGQEFLAIDTTVSTTDAVMLACALLRAHGLNPFDLALWFFRGGAGHAGAGEGNERLGAMA